MDTVNAISELEIHKRNDYIHRIELNERSKKNDKAKINVTQNLMLLIRFMN